MGQARQRGNFEQRKAESLFYSDEQARLNEWLKSRRPKVTFLNSRGEPTSYRSCNRLAALYEWAQQADREILITA